MKKLWTFILCTSIAIMMAVPAAAQTDYSSLRLDDAEWTKDESTGAWCLNGITYCLYPVCGKEVMNIYVPGEYLDENGAMTQDTVNGYSVADAPIIYVVDMGGFAEARPAGVGRVSAYLEAGYVVATPGSRGKDTVDENGIFVGKGAESIADLKAGVRFVKYNDDILPGDAEKIVVTGTSAGGDMAALLAGSGNHPAFDPYLTRLGAVMTASDQVYAAQVYCPAADMEHADLLYEWMYDGVYEYKSAGAGGPGPGASSEEATEESLSGFQQALSEDLADLYVEYINEQQFIDPEGNLMELNPEDIHSGTYYDHVLNVLNDSLEYYIEVSYGADGAIDKDAAQAYIDELNGDAAWVEAEFPEDGTVICTISDMESCLAACLPRGSACPSMDTFEMTSAANQICGTVNEDFVHYSLILAELLEKEEYQELEGYDPAIVQAYADAPAHAEAAYMINPLNFIGESDTAQYVRLRAGTADNMLPPLICLNTALAFDSKTDAEVDFALAWMRPHGEAETNAADLMEWMEQICR